VLDFVDEEELDIVDEEELDIVDEEELDIVDEEELDFVDEEELDFDELMLLLLVVDTTLLTLLVCASDESMYISSLLPAPQYSYGLPGQVNEQSERVVLTDPALGDVPQ